MSDTPKTKTYHVRLIKGFTHPLGHARAGYRFLPGPDPIEVELTPEQKKLIDADPSLEYYKPRKAAESNGDPKSGEGAGESSNRSSGRNYGGNEQTTPPADGGKKEGEGDAPEGDDDAPVLPTTEELLALDNDALREQATKEGVTDVKKLKNTQEVVDAIEAVRAEAAKAAESKE